MAFSSWGRASTPLGIPLGWEAFSSSVKRITLRSTRMRDLAAYRPQQRGAHRLQPDPGVVASASGRGAGVGGDLDEVLHLFETLAAEFGEDPEFAPHLIEPPQVIGPVDLADSSVTVRVTVKTEPGEEWDISQPRAPETHPRRQRPGGHRIALPTPGGRPAQPPARWTWIRRRLSCSDLSSVQARA